MPKSPRLKKIVQSIRASGRNRADVFDSIYAKGGWGSTDENEDGLSSGSGSDLANSLPYVDAVAKYIVAKDIRSIVDVGCGDFRVSGRLLNALEDRNLDYLGLDVSETVVRRNQRLFGRTGITFACVDVCEDLPPAGDLVLVREVMQHLSLRDVERMIDNLKDFEHIIVTNTVAAEASGANVDIASGASSRAVLGEGLFLDRAPFAHGLTDLVVVDHAEAKSQIVTSVLALAR